MASISRLIATGVSFAAASPGYAEGPVQFGALYQGDVFSTWSDTVNGRARYVDSTHLTLDIDLSSLLSGPAPIIHADINVTSGGTPNDDAGTLQGIDNIEAGRPRTRIYELWAEQRLFDDKASIRAGFQELNAEFDATDSSGLLLNPSFGLSPELSATGSNGPSTFPSTAIGLRGLYAINENVDVLAAAFNADALTIGEPGGPDLAFNNGALVIAQVNWRGPANFSLGAWGYTQPQDDIRDVDATGTPLARDARGIFVNAERVLWGSSDEGATGFLRLGLSEGDTTDFKGGYQAGVLFNRPVASRPDSAASVGVATARTSENFRANARDGGMSPSRDETTLELTYSDKLLPWLTIQPDLQFTFNPGGDRDRDHAVSAGIRISIEPWSAT